MYQSSDVEAQHNGSESNTSRTAGFQSNLQAPCAAPSNMMRSNACVPKQRRASQARKTACSRGTSRSCVNGVGANAGQTVPLLGHRLWTRVTRRHSKPMSCPEAKTSRRASTHPHRPSVHSLVRQRCLCPRSPSRRPGQPGVHSRTR